MIPQWLQWHKNEALCLEHGIPFLPKVIMLTDTILLFSVVIPARLWGWVKITFLCLSWWHCYQEKCSHITDRHKTVSWQEIIALSWLRLAMLDFCPRLSFLSKRKQTKFQKFLPSPSKLFVMILFLKIILENHFCIMRTEICSWFLTAQCSRWGLL